MTSIRPRLGVVLLGNCLAAAAVQRRRVETFFVEAEQPSAALRAELDQRRLAPRSVALGLPRASVTVKPLDLPPVDGDLRDMVRFELERHLPFPSEDAAFDFVSLPGTGTPTAGAPGARQVLLVAADRRIVDTALRIAEEARLRARSLTVAAHDLVALAERPRRGQIVWLHRSGDVVDVLLLAGPALVLSRSLPAADDGVVADEVRRSFAVTRWRGCDAIWVSGDAPPPGTPADTPLSALGAPITEPPWTPRAQRLLAAAGEGPRGALTLALAVATAGRVRPLDLIPPALRARRLSRRQAVTAGLVAATVLLGLGALLVPDYRQSRRLDAINARVSRLDPEVKAVEAVQRELERKRKLLATIESVETSAIRTLPVLRELTDLLPSDAWLTMLSVDTKGVELTGQASAASALIPLLENSPRLERVEFASPVTRGRDKEQFRIRAAWEGGLVAAMSTLAAAGPGTLPPAGAPASPGAARGTTPPAPTAPTAATPRPNRAPGQ
ncbi:MAG: pilus assembly protein PilM [Candidatus Rokubacteria bacterium]|nr:pilus assembly protein PilM [Candidatus Rokubacteria bacterium]